MMIMKPIACDPSFGKQVADWRVMVGVNIKKSDAVQIIIQIIDNNCEQGYKGKV